MPVIGGAGGAFAFSRQAYYSGPVSDHFDGTRFFDPHGVPPKPFTELLRWQFGNDEKARWPETWPLAGSDKPPARVEGDAIRLAYVGHASFLLQTRGLNILLDPVWSERMSPVSFAGPKRANPPGIAFEDLPKIDLVLVSHGHYDHLDLSTLSRLQAAHQPRVITPLGQDAIMRGHDAAIRAEAHDWGDRVEIGNGMAVHLAPMRHWTPAACSTATRRCGRPSCWRRRAGSSTTSAIPAMATATISARPSAGSAASASPSCRSAPMSRAGSCATST